VDRPLRRAMSRIVRLRRLTLTSTKGLLDPPAALYSRILNKVRMQLVRTKQYHFAWLIIFPLLAVVFLMIFFLLLSSNFVLQPGISVNVPFSKFMLAPQVKYQIISITSGATVYFRDQKISIDELGPQLEIARKEGRSIIIKADRYTPYETVIRVANLALEHGVPSVALATTPPK
jgi:biopolymer transport protein ExbD